MQPNPLKDLKPLNNAVARHMIKDVAMANMATQFIGRSCTAPHLPSSTRNYQQAWGELANSGSYLKSDIIMVSGSGLWRGVTQAAVDNMFEVVYKPLLDIAIKANSSFVVGNANGMDCLVRKYLASAGYSLTSKDGFGLYEPSKSIKVTSKYVNLSADLTFKVDRSTLLGNPFELRDESERDAVIGAFREYLWQCMKSHKRDALRNEISTKVIASKIACDRKLLIGKAWKPCLLPQFIAELRNIRQAYLEKKSINLWCWCKRPGIEVACHGDVIKAAIEWLSTNNYL